MEYKDYRKNIKSGDLLAWTHRGWKSFYDIQIQAIRFFTQSEYSHVGIAWWSADRLFIIEALPPRVRIFPLSLAGDFYHIDINEPFEKEVEEFALNQVGEEYSK